MEYTLAQVTERYLEIRTEISELTDKYNADKAALTELLDMLGDDLHQRLRGAGSSSLKVPGVGTVTQRETQTPVVLDMGEFLRFIRTEGKPELLQARLSTTSCKEYAEDNGGVMPPGVSVETKISIAVRRA
jgi:hypothetical protein